MKTNTLPLNPIVRQIENWIVELQRSHVGLEEQLKTEQRNFGSSLNEVVFKIIDILDLITVVGSNIGLDSSINTQTIINKIEKMLVALLQHLRVEEIIFKDGHVEIGQIRVLETREVSDEIPAATIIEICRKGYQRNGTIIRPADVITAASNNKKSQS